jgi:hypothetical protein
MCRRQRLSIALALLVMPVGSDQVRAIVIDDFSSGPIVVNGPAVQDQTGLDPSHVVGGSRRIDVGRFGVGSRLKIADDQLQFGSTGWGYYTLTYGAVESLGGLDLTQGEHDRIRIKFGEVVSDFHLFGIYVNLPTSSSSNGVRRYASDEWDGMTVEIPYSMFPVSFEAVQSIIVDVSRNPAGTGFDVDSITTAGPSVAGDFNRDGAVNSDDLQEWGRYLGTSTRDGSIAGFLATSDANEDGSVDGADLLAWQRNLGASSSPPGAAVPEPSGALAALAAAVAMVAIGRRRLVR